MYSVEQDSHSLPHHDSPQGRSTSERRSGRQAHQWPTISAEKSPLNLPQNNQECDCNAHRLTRKISQPSSVLRDQLRQWLVCRHMSSSEACLRLIEMDVHKCEPGVSVLPIRREGQERISFDLDDIARADADSKKVETLHLRYFWRPESTQTSQLTYVQYHEQYVQRPECAQTHYHTVLDGHFNQLTIRCLSYSSASFCHQARGSCLPSRTHPSQQ